MGPCQNLFTRPELCTALVRHRVRRADHSSYDQRKRGCVCNCVSTILTSFTVLPRESWKTHTFVLITAVDWRARGSVLAGIFHTQCLERVEKVELKGQTFGAYLL